MPDSEAARALRRALAHRADIVKQWVHKRMPPFFEEAAHLLRLMVAAGLTIITGADYTALITRLAGHIAQLGAERESHATAAIRVLKDLEATGGVKCIGPRRAKMVAILGTAFGNFQAAAKTATPRHRRSA